MRSLSLSAAGQSRVLWSPEAKARRSASAAKRAFALCTTQTASSWVAFVFSLINPTWLST